MNGKLNPPEPPALRPEALAMLQNSDFEFAFELYDIFRLLIVCVELEQHPSVFDHPNIDEFLRSQLLPVADGSLDCCYWGECSLICFYHVREPRILPALQTIRNRLASLHWLPRCRIAVCDPDALCWRTFFDGTPGSQFAPEILLIKP